MRQLIICLMGLTLFSFILSCQKEISLEFGQPATGSLQSDAGECLPKLVAGSYIANKALNDSNFIEVTVNVTSKGPYTIVTDSSNGYLFRGTGTFNNVGTTTVRLKGIGRPVADGVNTFRVMFDSSICDVDVTVLPDGATGGPAVFTLEGAPGACASFGLNGTYYKDTTLDGRHTVNVSVNVTTVGTYTITTNVQNGYSFSRSGTFGSTGVQSITLNGSGKPAAVGTDNFTVTAGSSTCTFPVTVTTPAVTGGCTPALQGTFTAGTATTTANKVVVTYTYATAGSYTVSTNTVNGYSFGPATINATAGVNTITLNATGTPTTAGTNSFTIDLGNGQTCSFNVTVNNGTTPPPNNDYLPTTQNSWWSYDDGAGSDTFKLTVNGTATYSGNTFQQFIYSTTAGNFDTAFYRKDAATGFYYESMDTAGFGPQITFAQPRLNVLFLKNSLTTGATWNTDFPVTVSSIPVPVILRFKYTCINANAAMTVNGKNFTNVYRVELLLQANIGGAGFQDVSDPLEYNYARGIGLIRLTDQTDFQDIRNWMVN